ncbi:hypothetical protein [Spirosoma sp.]
MTKQTESKAHKAKRYVSPQLKKLGNVRQLTLKSGSNTDGLGGFI